MGNLEKRTNLACGAVWALILALPGCSVSQDHHVSFLGDHIAFVSSSPIPVPGDQPSSDTGENSIRLVAHQEPEPPMVREQDLAAPRPVTLEGANAPTAPSGWTLDQIINATLLADPQLRAGFEAINQAYGDAWTAALRPNPTLEIAQTLLPLTRPFTVDKQGGPPQLDIGGSYRIDWFLFGKRAAAMQAAALGVQASEAEFADRVRRRVLESAEAYYDVLEAKALLDLAHRDVANFRRIEEITQKAVAGGGRPQVELGRIRLDRLRAEQSVRDAENALVAAKARLRALMGFVDVDLAFDVSGTLEDIGTPALLPLEEAWSVAVQNRPDIEALRRRVAQAHLQAESERRQGYPEVSPQFVVTRQFQRQAIGFPDANSWGVGLEMSLPLFDRNQGNRLKAASVAVQQRYELQAGLVDLRAEVIRADNDLRTALANAKAVAEQQLKLAGQVRDNLNRAYEAGGRPLIDVLDAQRNYHETYRLFIESRANLGRAAVRYNAVLGRRIAP